MSWIIFALGAISASAVSDIFRKLGSNLKDPFLSNLIFQIGSITMAVFLYFTFSRKTPSNPRDAIFALIGGLLVSVFTTLSFKALAVGPGVSTVMPAIRVGAVTFVAILGIILLRDKITPHVVFGILFSALGVYLLFSGK
ncbi:MAG: EamA family transporter [Patescibacteria group bacterium]|nr:EamA family transporter [Patescibacteria group bacterium]